MTLLAALFLLLQGAAGQRPTAPSGVNSAKATSLRAAFVLGDKVPVLSPDGRSTAVASVDEDTNRFTVNLFGALGRGEYPVAYGPNQELMWAQDSKAFFITADHGGDVGMYELTVVGQQGGKTVRKDLTSWLAREFGHPVKCSTPEDPNVAGIAWLGGGSNRLLVAAQVLPHSHCDSMGTFVTYEIDPFRQVVLAKHGQLESKQKFGDLLGPKLLAADDRCIKTPEFCWIDSLHPNGAAAKKR